MNTTADPSWLDLHERSALDDFWAFCAPLLSGQVARATATRESTAASQEWRQWDEHFRLLGQAAAADSRAVADSTAMLRAVRRVAHEALLARFPRDTKRALDAANVLNDVLDHGFALLSDAYAADRTELLLAREEDLATTLDSIGDAVIVTDAKGYVVRMNPVAERLTGFPFTSCQGLPLDLIFRIEHETTGEPVESPAKRVLADGVVVGLANHTTLVSRDGRRIPIADSGAPVRKAGGEIRGVVLVFRDVSEERKAQDALLHWERIFQHATWGVAVASARDVSFHAVNPAYAQMHGYTVDELLGAPVSTLWAAETRTDMERHASETHDHGRLVAETVHVRKNGTKVPVEVVATTIKDAQGNVEWFVANVQDITERRRLQQSRIRALELEAENRRVEEANRLKGDFLASMSHELRTPLNSIIGFAELLHDDQVGAATEKQKEFLREILGGGRHLLRLINDVLDLAKVEAGKVEFRPEPTDVRAIIDTVVNGSRATVQGRALTIQTIVPDNFGEVVIDPGRFKQVLYNYLSNALKFTPDGGEIVVRVTNEPENRFRVAVEDNGIGVSQEDAKRLFVAFQQVDGSAAKRLAGTGLGLALTKKLAEAQGGVVGLEPRSGGGSIFYAVLPRRPDGYAASDARLDVSGLGTLLVIDFDADHTQLLVDMLRSSGYRVDAVASCEEALAAWERHPYAAIVMDVLEGATEVHPLLQRIRQDPTCRTPVIALSIIDTERVVAGYAVNDVLTKPVEKESLLAALERAGVKAMSGAPVVVIDDDGGSLKLMAATLAQLGYDSLCFEGARGALLALQELRPAAIVLDLIMPEMDGFTFLEKYRTNEQNRSVPIMVWTVKDLSDFERSHLRSVVNAIVQKGIHDGSRLAAALHGLLDDRAKEAVAQ
jgi:PAS domain S-box-containing protein